MIIIGLITRSGEARDADGKPIKNPSTGAPYYNLAVEGFNLIPSRQLLENGGLPAQGATVKLTVSTYYQEKGKPPLYFCNAWENVTF